ncbi:hypothetical protein, partial [Streptomyces noursei]|uniref:hypothetical protein n=1 Tax=Streptomyces noursei TaxID=1971 RepID=UPI000A66F2EA
IRRLRKQDAGRAALLLGGAPDGLPDRLPEGSEGPADRSAGRAPDAPACGSPVPAGQGHVVREEGRTYAADLVRGPAELMPAVR